MLGTRILKLLENPIFAARSLKDCFADG